ncbi:hypothetical protein BGZ65_004421, partial [Modicella reniformis]
SLVPATNQHSKDEEYEIGDETNSKAKVKRPRKVLQLQKRLEIIANQEMSVTYISKKFNVPRATIYRIINDKDTLKKLAQRPAKRRELLVTWFLDLTSRGITVTNNMLTAQAFVVHRMVSDLLVGSLPACTFSSGWLKRFKDRRKSSLEAAHCPVDQDGYRLFVEERLRHFSGSLDDIYTYGFTSMYLDMLPSRIYDGSSQELSRMTVDGENATIILCCNASGTDMREPRIRVQSRLGAIPANYSMKL